MGFVKVNELALKFEQKLLKRAEEVTDSGFISTIIGSVLHNMLSNDQNGGGIIWYEKFKKIFLTKGKEGDWLTIGSDEKTPGGGGFTTNAKLTKNKLNETTWSAAGIITISGTDTLISDPDVLALKKNFEAACSDKITKELNRIKSSLIGDSITQHKLILVSEGLVF